MASSKSHTCFGHLFLHLEWRHLPAFGGGVRVAGGNVLESLSAQDLKVSE